MQGMGGRKYQFCEFLEADLEPEGLLEQDSRSANLLNKKNGL